MKILMLETESPSLRAEVIGWEAEDSDLFIKGKPVGYSPPLQDYHRYNSVLEAMAYGWNLMAPPLTEEAYQSNCCTYTWWLSK